MSKAVTNSTNTMKDSRRSEGEDGVGESFALKAAALFLHAIISDVGVYAFCNNHSRDLLCDIKEADGSPVVWAGVFSLQFEAGVECVKPPFFWDWSSLPN